MQGLGLRVEGLGFRGIKCGVGYRWIQPPGFRGRECLEAADERQVRRHSASRGGGRQTNMAAQSQSFGGETSS